MKKSLLILSLLFTANTFAAAENRKGEIENKHFLSGISQNDKKIMIKLKKADPKDINLILNKEFENDSKEIQSFIGRNELYELMIESDKSVE